MPRLRVVGIDDLDDAGQAGRAGILQKQRTIQGDAIERREIQLLGHAHPDEGRAHGMPDELPLGQVEGARHRGENFGQ